MGATVKQKNPGWLDRLRKRRTSSKAVAVGFPADEVGSLNYPDGTPLTLVAAVNNYGSSDGRIPRRDFMGPGAKAAIEATAGLRAGIVAKVDKGQGDIDKDWAKVGLVAQAQIQNAIAELSEPALAESTAERKGSTKPLQDTGLMIGAVTFSVRDK